jgi:hypothetical protein
MIRKIITLLLASFLFSTVAAAQESCKDTLGVLGKWKVWAESPSKEKEKKEVDNLWEFTDKCILHAVSEDPRTKTLDVSVNYHIENGVILKEKPGRPGKFDRCTVEKVEGKDNEIILGCPGLYFFLKKVN